MIDIKLRPGFFHDPMVLERSGFSVRKVWSRDTWDAQIYDWMPVRFIAVLKRLSGQAGKEWFLVEESVRIAFAGLSFVFNILHGWLSTGSELLVLSRK